MNGGVEATLTKSIRHMQSNVMQSNTTAVTSPFPFKDDNIHSIFFPRLLLYYNVSNVFQHPLMLNNEEKKTTGNVSEPFDKKNQQYKIARYRFFFFLPVSLKTIFVD